MTSSKLLFVHIPKTAGVYIGEYISVHLNYRRILSNKSDTNGIWSDFTLDEIKQFINEENVIMHTHVLSYGWNGLTPMIPLESKQEIASTIRSEVTQL